MDRLAIMRSFVGVTKARSFSKAARGLGISASLVSRHVAELERSLGIRLVNRTAQTISLTDAGTRYAEFAARIINEIDQEDALYRSPRDKPEGTLAINSSRWIADIDIGDVIVAFCTRYPKIHIRLDVGTMPEFSYEFLDEDFDIVFHNRDSQDCNLPLRKIADLGFSLCAAPLYLGRAGWPSEVGELGEHDCLLNSNDPVWHLRHHGHDVHLEVSEPVYSSNSYLTLRKAALAGRGIGLLPDRLVRDDLAGGTLVNILPSYEMPDRSLYAAHASEGRPPARVQLFLNFASDWFQNEAGHKQLSA